MQNLVILVISFLMASSINAQNEGTITYQETVKLEIQGADVPGVDLSSMLPPDMSFSKELKFRNHESVYSTVNQEEVEDAELESDDGSFKMVISYGDELPEILYTNQKEKSRVHQRGFMGKSFVVSEALPKFKWKITNEKIKYLDYECTKATTENEEGKTIVAWFTSQIPVQLGPASYGQLPGLVLMVSVDDGKTEIKAVKVELSKVEGDIQMPKDGKKVSGEEYDKIVDEKMKEMEEMNGGNSFIIRN